MNKIIGLTECVDAEIKQLYWERCQSKDQVKSALILEARADGSVAYMTSRMDTATLCELCCFLNKVVSQRFVMGDM